MADDDTKKQSHSPLSGKTAVQAARIGGHESEPMGGGRATVELTPIREKPMSPEVAKYIQQQEDSIQLDDVLRQAGVTKGHDEKIEDVQGPHLPMNDDQIAAGLKQPINNSARWLATLMLYLLEQSHYTLKTVKGHVYRVFKP